MIWLLLSLTFTVFLELIAIQLKDVKRQKALALVPIVFIAVESILIIVYQPQVWSFVVGYLSIFRIINMLKLIHGGKQKDYLKSSTTRTSLVLVIGQIAIVLMAYGLNSITTSYHLKWGILVVVELLGVMVIGFSLRFGLLKSKPKIVSRYIVDKQLPSLTVAIPARNETFILEDCLKSLLASDYPKLEVLVLDDCSQEKRTPEIIRQFAHDGVRFLAGKVPSEAWTAKNYAYEQLLEEASGELVLFCGVDALFEKDTLRKMVELKVHKHKVMLSFMPLNVLPENRFKRLLIQPVRYLWELGLPRDYSKRPPVLSTCWLIDRAVLGSNGGFKAVSRSIIPERYFARQTARNNDGYSFIALGDRLGFSCTKTFNEQYDTALRTRYPSLRQRLEDVAFICLLEAILFVVPFGLVIYEAVYGSWLLVATLVINILISCLIYRTITRQTYGRNLGLSYFVYPLVFIYDIGLNLYSMYQYEFNEVIWKGRNVCIPVMKVIPSLYSEQK